MTLTDYEAIILALTEAHVDDETMARIATSFAKHRVGVHNSGTIYSLLAPALVEATLANDRERIDWLVAAMNGEKEA